MPATKEHIRQIITDNNLNSVADVQIASQIQGYTAGAHGCRIGCFLGYERTAKKIASYLTKEMNTHLKK